MVSNHFFISTEQEAKASAHIGNASCIPVNVVKCEIIVSSECVARGRELIVPEVYNFIIRLVALIEQLSVGAVPVGELAERLDPDLVALNDLNCHLESHLDGAHVVPRGNAENTVFSRARPVEFQL